MHLNNLHYVLKVFKLVRANQHKYYVYAISSMRMTTMLKQISTFWRKKYKVLTLISL
jgi:hypothetical protein